MDAVVVRYGEIGTKSDRVRSEMTNVLRQRVNDGLEYEGIEFEKVSTSPGRIICRDVQDTLKAAKIVSKLPGVASASPAYSTPPQIEDINLASQDVEIGDTFGVDARTAGEHDFGSQDIERELGAKIEEETGSTVNLDNPETLVEVDVRPDEAFLFSERFEGPQGYPVGTGEDVAALISGGIDSPVAAYRLMCKGSKIIPIYFYNRPIAAEDHLFRFKSVIEELKKFNPSRDWEVYVVDMQDVNETLLNQVDRGRMIAHRRIMFRIAERIKDQQGLSGIVTGESIAQKSSQTVSNLETTSKSVESNILRPLLSEDKYSIVSEAKEIGTFQDSKIESACNSLSPENPATKIGEDELEKIEEQIDIDRLVQKAFDSTEVEQI